MFQPRFSDPVLFGLPTAELELEDPLFVQKGIKVFIKRDDLIHPFISGNKWRKLKYVLTTAQALHKTHLLTFGGAWSNHLLATACLGAAAGIRTTGIVRGEPGSSPSDVLFLCSTFGMELIYVSRELYRDKPALATKYTAPETYVIPEGGACKEGLIGCAEMVSEFSRSYNHVVVACGTSTTAIGIAQGLAALKMQGTVEAIVVLKNAEYLESVYLSNASSLLPIRFHHAFHGGGYAKINIDLRDWMNSFIRSTGMILDPVYTAKAMKSLYELTTNDFFSPGSKVLFIHTGGMMGLLGLNQGLKNQGAPELIDAP